MLGSALPPHPWGGQSRNTCFTSLEHPPLDLGVISSPPQLCGAWALRAMELQGEIRLAKRNEEVCAHNLLFWGKGPPPSCLYNAKAAKKEAVLVLQHMCINRGKIANSSIGEWRAPSWGRGEVGCRPFFG